MSYCDGLISKDITQSCDNPAVKGFERIGILINREDIDFSGLTFDTTKKNVITAIPLKSGKKGYKVVQKGATPFTGSTSSAEVGTYGTGFTNNIAIAILNNNEDIAENVVDSLANGEFVFIGELKDKGADKASAFRVYGIHNGLTLSAYEHDPYGDTYAGGLATLTETGAPKSAVYLGASYTAGKTLFDSLLGTAE